MRVYLPATLPMLRGWLDAGEARLGDDRAGLGFAVTPALREWYFDADLDELEHAAQVAAALGSLELLAAAPAAPRRRVVVAVDVDDSDVSAATQHSRAAVTLAGRVTVSRWGSALVDDVDVEPVVAAAVAGLADAANGDDDAQFALDEAESRELGWYAVQELRHLFS